MTELEVNSYLNGRKSFWLADSTGNLIRYYVKFTKKDKKYFRYFIKNDSLEKSLWEAHNVSYKVLTRDIINFSKKGYKIQGIDFYYMPLPLDIL